MSEELPDILTYTPISEPTGQVVNFGMPTHDGNKKLTQIVTSSKSALEATRKAFDVSTLSETLAPAIEPEKLAIIRMFFGDQGEFGQLDLDIYEDVTDSHFIESYASALSTFPDRNTYEISWSDYHFIGFASALANIPTTHYRPPALFDGTQETVDHGTSATYGNYSNPGDWETDGIPYIDFHWSHFDYPHCSSWFSAHTTEALCEAYSFWGYCRQNHTSDWAAPGRPPMTERKNDGKCFAPNTPVPFDVSVPQYDDNYANCVNTGNVWQARGLVEAKIGLYANATYCEGTNQCFYQTGGNSDYAQWYNYNPGGINTEQQCMTYAVGNWPHLYWMWRAGTTNTWTAQYSQWHPSQDSIDSHHQYNLYTSDNHRKYPEWFARTGTTAGGLGYWTTGNTINTRLYYTDEAETEDARDSYGWGRGNYNISPPNLQVGRAKHPFWFTNTFMWPDGAVTDTTSTATAGAFVIGEEYTILVPGDTDFTLVGAADSTAGTVFTATGAGTGSGTATWIEHVANKVHYQTQIYGNMETVLGFPAHSFVAHNDSMPQSLQGLVSSTHAQIRFRAPQYNYNVQDRRYPPPDYYMVYRSPYFYNHLTLTGSDYERGVWKYAGWVNHTTDTGYMYFYDPREELVKLGLSWVEYSYYKITAVWSNWNWQRGFSLSEYANGPYEWDPVLGGQFSWFQTFSSFSNYETHTIHIDNNTNYRSYRARGYLRAPTTGQYAFHIRSDDSMYLWIGNNGQSIGDLEADPTQMANAVVDAPGLHGDWVVTGYINLVADEIYPIVVYNGNHSGGHTMWVEWTPPGGARTFDFSKHVTPETEYPSFSSGQRMVEGYLSNQAFSYYTQ